MSAFDLKDGVDLFYSSSFWAYAKENTPTALVTCSQCTCIEDWNITMSSFSIFNLCSMERRSLRVCTVLGNCSEAFSVRQKGRSSDCLHHFTSDAKNLKWDIPEENVQEAVHLHSAFVFALVLKVWQCVPKRPQELSASLNTLWTRTCSQTIILGPGQIHLAKALRLHPRPGWQRFPVSKFALVALYANRMFVSLCWQHAETSKSNLQCQMRRHAWRCFWKTTSFDSSTKLACMLLIPLFSNNSFGRTSTGTASISSSVRLKMQHPRNLFKSSST